MCQEITRSVYIYPDYTVYIGRGHYGHYEDIHNTYEERKYTNISYSSRIRLERIINENIKHIAVDIHQCFRIRLTSRIMRSK